MVDTLSARETVMPPATKEDYIIRLLETLVEGRVEEIGPTPNLFVKEFDLAAGATQVVTADTLPDRWVIYARPNSGALLRVFMGGDVPKVNAYECMDGQRLVLTARNQQVAVFNSGGLTAHVFVVAVGGGLEFDVTGLPGQFFIVPAILGVDTTAAAGGALTLTLPAVVGMYHYITRIRIAEFAAALLAAAAVPVIVTSTNLPGNRTITFPARAMPQGELAIEIVTPPGPIRSVAANTATTLVMPATGNAIWHATVDYYAAP